MSRIAPTAAESDSADSATSAQSTTTMVAPRRPLTGFVARRSTPRSAAVRHPQLGSAIRATAIRAVAVWGRGPASPPAASRYAKLAESGHAAATRGPPLIPRRNTPGAIAYASRSFGFVAVGRSVPSPFQSAENSIVSGARRSTPPADVAGSYPAPRQSAAHCGSAARAPATRSLKRKSRRARDSRSRRGREPMPSR